jgi:tight adherence protein B
VSPILGVIVFLVLAAVILIAVSLGYRFLESQRAKHVKGVLTVVENAPKADTTIMVDRARTDALTSALQNADFGKRMGQYIQQGGLEWTVSGLTIAMAIGASVGAIIGWMFRPLGFLTLSVAGLAFVFGGAPYFILLFRRNRRLAEFEQQLPEALDFLARSMRAGHAFSISIEMLGQESPDPLGQEFRVLFNEQNLGAPLETALASFAARVPLLDIRMFVSSVLLQKQTGGNLGEILSRLAYLIRERFRLRGQVKASSAHGRMTATVLTLLPVVLVVILLIVAPGYIQTMAADPDGKWMIVGAVAAQILGFFVIRRITNIKV